MKNINWMEGTILVSYDEKDYREAWYRKSSNYRTAKTGEYMVVIQERATAFVRLRCKYRFSEYDLHASAKEARCTWIADHLDSTMAQTLATRAYQAYRVIPHHGRE